MTTTTMNSSYSDFIQSPSESIHHDSMAFSSEDSHSFQLSTTDSTTPSNLQSLLPMLADISAQLSDMMLILEGIAKKQQDQSSQLHDLCVAMHNVNIQAAHSTNSHFDSVDDTDESHLNYEDDYHFHDDCNEASLHPTENIDTTGAPTIATIITSEEEENPNDFELDDIPQHANENAFHPSQSYAPPLPIQSHHNTPEQEIQMQELQEPYQTQRKPTGMEFQSPPSDVRGPYDTDMGTACRPNPASLYITDSTVRRIALNDDLDVCPDRGEGGCGCRYLTNGGKSVENYNDNAGKSLTDYICCVANDSEDNEDDSFDEDGLDCPTVERLAHTNQPQTTVFESPNEVDTAGQLLVVNHNIKDPILPKPTVALVPTKAPNTRLNADDNDVSIQIPHFPIIAKQQQATTAIDIIRICNTNEFKSHSYHAEVLVSTSFQDHLVDYLMSSHHLANCSDAGSYDFAYVGDNEL